MSPIRSDGGVNLEFDPEEEGVVVPLMKAIADRQDVQPHHLPPLEYTVPVDALENALRSHPSVTVTFEYESYRITASGSGDIRIEPPN